MEPRKVLLIGDSHIYAIQAALDDARLVPPGFDFEALRLAALKNNEMIGDITLEAALERIAALAPRDIFVTLLRGNQFNTMGLIQHPQPFDVMMPGPFAEHVEEHAEIIPLQVICSFFADSLRNGYGRQLIRLKRASAAPVACLAPPAPKEDGDHILRGAETYFKEHGIDKIGVTPAPVRLKLWTLQQQSLQAFCLEHGIVFLDNPPEAREDTGYLKRRYYAGDATHGNRHYGSLVLAQVARLAEEYA